MKPRRSAPKLKRKNLRLEPKRSFILFWEGEKTETEYFNAIRRTCSKTLIAVETHGGVGVPKTIAEKAIEKARSLGLTPKSRRKKDSYEKRDQVWAIFDRDDHPHFDEAVRNCESQNVGVGRSNPCFELWLILHEQDYDKPNDRHAMQKALAKLRPEYKLNGAKTPDCADLVKRVEAAEQRGAKQLQNRESGGDPYGNPSTTVGRLTRAIREADLLATKKSSPAAQP